MTSAMVALLSSMIEQPTAVWYGLDLAKRANLKSGTIYPALARLERAGWLESHWEDVDPSVAGRPRRRLYRLTGIGEAETRRKFEELAAQVTRVRRPRQAWDAGSGVQPA